MPTILYASTVRETHEGFTLSMKAQHTLIVGEPSADAVHAKGRLPNIDVVSQGDVVLSLAGLSNGRKISTSVMASSACSNQLYVYLKNNASELGLSTTSNIYVDEEDNLVKVNLSPSSPYEAERGYPRAHLTSIKITFIYRCVARRDPEAHDIFSERPFLPFTASLDNLMEKFVSVHLVRRYPLVFGTMRQKLQAERSYYPHIARSISSVISRSSNAEFEDSTILLLERLRRRLSREAQDISEAYKKHAGVDDEQDAPLFEYVNDINRSPREDVLSSCLSRVSRLHTHAPSFKSYRTGSLGSIKRDPQDPLALFEGSNSLHIPEDNFNSSLPCQHLMFETSFENAPTDRTFLDIAESSVAMGDTLDVDYDSGSEDGWVLGCAALPVVEDDDDNCSIMDDSSAPGQSPLVSPSKPNFYFEPEFDQDMDDPSNCLFDDGYIGARLSSSTYSPESSQGRMIETPTDSQVTYMPGGVAQESTDILWLDDDPVLGSFNQTHPSISMPGCVYLVDTDDETSCCAKPQRSSWLPVRSNYVEEDIHRETAVNTPATVSGLAIVPDPDVSLDRLDGISDTSISVDDLDDFMQIFDETDEKY